MLNMRHPGPTQHCPTLTKEQRRVLDEAAEEYGVPWHVTVGSKHYKFYLGGCFVAVISLGKTTNAYAPVSPEARLRQQIKRAMATKE